MPSRFATEPTGACLAVVVGSLASTVFFTAGSCAFDFFPAAFLAGTFLATTFLVAAFLAAGLTTGFESEFFSSTSFAAVFFWRRSRGGTRLARDNPIIRTAMTVLSHCKAQRLRMLQHRSIAIVVCDHDDLGLLVRGTIDLPRDSHAYIELVNLPRELSYTKTKFVFSVKEVQKP